MPKLKLNRIIIFGLFILMILIGLLVYQIHQDFNAVIENNKWVNHTLNVIHNAEKINSFIKDAESSQRGFIISRDSSHFFIYRASSDSITPLLTQLKELTLDNDSQHVQVGLLEVRIRERLDMMGDRLRQLTDNPNFNAEFRKGFQKGKKVMDEIRRLILSIGQKEEELMKERTNALENSIGRFYHTQILFTSFMFVFITLFIIAVLNQLAKTRRNNEVLSTKNEQIQRLNEELGTSEEEQKSLNEELTALNDELVSSNNELNNKNSNIEVLNKELSSSNLILLDQNNDIKALNEELNAANETIRLQSEQLLAKSEHKYQNLVYSIQDVFFAFDTELQYTYLNSAGEKFIGKKMEEVIGRHYLEVLPHLKDTEYEHFFKKALITQQAQKLFVDYQKNGIDIYFELNAYPSDFGVSVFAKDITADKTAELKLRDSEEKYKFLFEYNPNPMLIYDTETLDFIDVNHTAILKYGYSKTEFLGMNLKQIRHSVSGIKIKKTVKKLDLGYSETLGLVHRKKDGILFDVEIHGYMFIDKDKVRRLVSINDITERKKSEIKVGNLIEELVDKNKSLLEYTYIVSHQLRSPIANIKGLVSVFDRYNVSDSFNLEVIDNLAVSSERLDMIVSDLNEILSIRRVENNQRSMISLSDIFQKVEKDLMIQIKDAQAVIEKDFSEVSTVFTIYPYLENILYNLLSNAIKFKSEERRLVIEASSQIIEETVCISIADNGLGINMGLFKDKIFGMYNRFHLSHEGKGFGLYLVKTQVEVLGGRIEVESEIDKGSIFKVYLKTT